MPTVDLEVASVVSENFVGSSAIKLEADDGNLATAILNQVAVLELDDLPAAANTVTSVQIFVEAGVNAGKSTARMDLKLLDSSGTTLADQAIDVSTTTLTTVHNTGVATTTDAGDAYTPAIVNDMRLQVKHGGNISGTPTLQMDYAFVRVVYEEASELSLYNTTINNIHLQTGNINISSGNISI